VVAYFHLCSGCSEHNPIAETETKTNISKMKVATLLLQL
jgi:hypothetical protein